MTHIHVHHIHHHHHHSHHPPLISIHNTISIQYNTIQSQYNTIQHNTTQHNTTQHTPNTVQIIGVEPTGANAMAQSLAQGSRVTLSRVDAFADGVAVKQVGAETFRLCREYVDGVVLVDNSAISAGIKDVFNETRNILEPAGAVAVAGAKAYCKTHADDVRGSEEGGGVREMSLFVCSIVVYSYVWHLSVQCQLYAYPPHLPFLLACTGGTHNSIIHLTPTNHHHSTQNHTGKVVVAVTSGANMNFDRLRLVSELADVGAREEAMLATTIPEAPGSFKEFVSTALGKTDIQVTEFKYR